MESGLRGSHLLRSESLPSAVARNTRDEHDCLWGVIESCRRWLPQWILWRNSTPQNKNRRLSRLGKTEKTNKLKKETKY